MSQPSTHASFRPVVLMPTFNNAGTLESVMNAAAALDLPLMVVNDGSTDDTPAILDRWDSGGGRQAIILHHAVNQGKAAALRTGFAAASKEGFTHAATLDTDGQLDPADLPALLRRAEQTPRALVLGSRAWHIQNYPSKNLLGRRLSNAAIRLQSGVRINDSQCGLRIYPVDLMRRIRVTSNRFSFEAEAITRAAWAGCPIIEVPIRCTYAPPGERVSHYIPSRDTPRAILTHLAMLVRSILPLPHRKWG